MADTVLRDDYSSNKFIALFIFCLTVCFILVLFFLERGTIIGSVYADIKSQTSAFSAASQQIFNVAVALIFSSLKGKKERLIFAAFLVLFVAYFLLVARRIPAMATILLICYILDIHRLNFVRVVAIIATVALFDFIGDVRSISLNEYFSGVDTPQQFRADFSLPGGASNVFVTVLGVADLIMSGTLSFPETFPVILWFTSGSFESRIYESMGYDYNGGMLFTNILLWNFGILGLCIGGWLSGRVMKVVDNNMKWSTDHNVGSYGTAVSVLVLMLIPNITWYSPIAFVNAFLLLSVLYWPWIWIENFLRGDARQLI